MSDRSNFRAMIHHDSLLVRRVLSHQGRHSPVAFLCAEWTVKDVSVLQTNHRC